MRYLTSTNTTLALLLTLIAGYAHSNPDGYTFIAEENQSKTFNFPVDLAYGADGQYYYIDDFVGTIRFDNKTFGGDPIKGVEKAGYVKNSSVTSSDNRPIRDYELVANENETMTFRQPVDLAYGAKDRYHHIDNFIGTITFDNETFGGDPIKGVAKAGYMKPHRNVADNNPNDQEINDYQFAANENETKTFRRPVDLAYGANGQYHYINDFVGTIRFDNKTFGGDPIEGVTKTGYVKYRNKPEQHSNINDYELVAKEGESKTFRKPVDLAYGAKGQYHYIYDFTGTIRFDNQSFDGDPIGGVSKFGYVKRTDEQSHSSQDISDYKRVASENQSKTFHQPVDLAYGANGQYHFIENFTGTIRFDNKTFGGDPIEGVNKAGYMKLSEVPPSQNHSQNINDYKFIANENERRTFNRPVDLAYGANNKYYFIQDFTGTIRFDNDTFGGDPSPGNKKKGYVRQIKIDRQNDRDIGPKPFNTKTKQK